jgi:hypothetical protein
MTPDLSPEGLNAPLERSPYRIDQTDLVAHLSCGELRRTRHSGDMVIVGPGRILYATELPDVPRHELEEMQDDIRAVSMRLDATISINNKKFFDRISVDISNV